jgi:Fe-Mn family superoxide dismutase
MANLRWNMIEEKLAELDPATASTFLIKGLKCKELMAMNSMILHELFSDGLGDQSEPASPLKNALAVAFRLHLDGKGNWPRLRLGAAVAVVARSSINGHRALA